MSVQWDLEQMRLFVSVAEERSFSAVARGQRKAQSAVSSGIALLEADLGVVLFDRSSGRQPRLTEAGSVLLEEAREVLRQCERLTGRALSLTRGEEACLRLAQDEAMLFQPVLDSLEALAVHYPLLEVQLSSAAQGDVARKLVENWPCWFVVNIASMGLFALKQLWLTVLLYGVFAVLSLVGWHAWRQRLKERVA